MTGETQACVCVCSGTWRARPALGHQSRQPGFPAPSGLPHPEWVRARLPSAASPFPHSLLVPPAFPGTLTPLPACFPPQTSLLHPPSSGHLDAKAADGNTALHCAVLHGQLDCLKLLLKGRAPVGAGAARGPLQTPPQTRALAAGTFLLLTCFCAPLWPQGWGCHSFLKPQLPLLSKWECRRASEPAEI